MAPISCSARDTGGSCSRGIGAGAAEFDPVMEPIGPVVPEFHHARDHAVADPERRPRHRAHGEFRAVKRDRLLEGEPALERPRLLAGPGADLGGARAAGEIGIGFRGADRLHRPAQPHLAPQRFPVERKARLGVVGEFAPLLAAVVAVEDEAALVEPLEQHHPDIGQPVGIDGRQRHRFGIGGLGLAGILEPGGEQPQRLLGFGEITPLTAPGVLSARCRTLWGRSRVSGLLPGLASHRAGYNRSVAPRLWRRLCSKRYCRQRCAVFRVANPRHYPHIGEQGPGLEPAERPEFDDARPL